MKLFCSSVEILEDRIAPATFTVNSLADSGAGTLRGALLAADGSSGPDTIVFHLAPHAPGGENVITLASALTSLGNVTIIGPGSGKLIIDGDQKDRVFKITDNDISKDSPVSISGLSIVNGKVTGNNNGGGILTNESLTLTDVVVSGNDSANNGGGISTGADTGAHIKIKISNSLITGNAASSVGGGMNIYGVDSFILSKTTVSGNNTVTHGGGGVYAELNTTGKSLSITGSVISKNGADHGGGLFLYTASPTGKVTISASTITGNSVFGNAAGGGGVYLQAGSVTIAGTKISNNYASNSGGGLESHAIASLTISKSTISGNRTSANGGGVYIDGGGKSTLQPAKVTGSSFLGNFSTGTGGGMYATDGLALTISSSTFLGNSARESGGGLETFGNGPAVVNLTISKSTLSGNVAAFGGGGFYAGGSGSVALSTVTADGNSGSTGGGISIAGASTATLTGVITRGNEAPTNGGGLQLSGVNAFTITHGVFSDNLVTGVSGGVGGGVAITGSAGSITKSTISGNTSQDNAGGIYMQNDGVISIVSSKITGNTATNGAGGGILAKASGQSLTITNSTISGNDAFFGGGVYAVNIKTLTISGGSVSSNAAIDGAGIEISSSIAGNAASIANVLITHNVADIAPALFNTGSNPAAVMLQIAKVIANTSTTGVDVVGNDITDT